VILGDDDRENEEFLGFDLDNIEETEERYIRQLDVSLHLAMSARTVSSLLSISSLFDDPISENSMSELKSFSKNMEKK
jgi:hypothetical protein